MPVELDLTSVTIMSPRKKQTTQMASRRSLRRWPTWKKAGYKSQIAVARASRPTNWNKDITFFSTHNVLTMMQLFPYQKMYLYLDLHKKRKKPTKVI